MVGWVPGPAAMFYRTAMIGWVPRTRGHVLQSNHPNLQMPFALSPQGLLVMEGAGAGPWELHSLEPAT